MFATNKNKFFLIIVLLISLVTMGAKCGGPGGNLTPGSPASVTLTWWKVWEPKQNVIDLINSYQKEHPHIKINYRNLSYEEFAPALLNALATDRGPDIFSVNTNWMRDYTDKILPMPPSTTIDYRVVQGSIKEEVYTEPRTSPTLSFKDLRDLFPDVVYNNQYINNKVYGLPLSIDTLALYSNRDLLNNAGIISPPKSWSQFQEDIVKLTKQSPTGEILQAGAALGTADNVERSFDILSLLMLQNGTQMTSSRNKITLSPREGVSINPAAQALDYYTSFANPAKQVYTWNKQMNNSLDEFINGNLAFFIGYAYHLETIKSRAPGLNLEITPMLQISEDSKINYANYWVETVSNKSRNPDEAWHFVLYMTTNLNANKAYLNKNKKPTALKALIEQQSQDYELGAFASQLLTAQSWYRGRNYDRAEVFFKQLIKDGLAGTKPTKDLIYDIVLKLGQIY